MTGRREVECTPTPTEFAASAPLVRIEIRINREKTRWALAVGAAARGGRGSHQASGAARRHGSRRCLGRRGVPRTGAAPGAGSVPTLDAVYYTLELYCNISTPWSAGAQTQHKDKRFCFRR